MGSSYYDQMHRQQATSSSKLSTSSHNMTTGTNNNSNSRSIATNTAKVLNKINTLVRPPESFLKAALKKMKMQDQQRAEGGGGWGHQTGEAGQGVGGGSYDRFPSSNSLKSMPSMHSFRLESSAFERPRGGLTTSSSTPMVSTPASARFPSRVLSVEALRAPRPLSERALIPLVPRAGRSELVPERAIDSSSTLVASPAVMPRSNSSDNIAEGASDSRTAVDPGTRTRRGRTRRMRSIDSIPANDGELAAEEEGNQRSGGRSARRTRAWQETEDIHGSGVAVGRVTKCYVCQEPCKSGASLCNECRTRFQPLGEVFEDSESEYEDEPVAVPYSPPKQGRPVIPATPPTSDRRGDSISFPAEAEDTSSRASSGQSSASKRLRELASRSTSVSPTPQLAHNIQLKVVPYPMIRKVSVSSPFREREEHRRSALYHIQQTMKPREPLTPGADPDEGRDAIRVGSVHSGEEDGEAGEYVSEHYEAVSPSPITNSELFRSNRNRASARSSTYDLIYSIYNDYCDQQEDVEYGGMF
ncbi:hypothetical protein VMCG_04618 [Cytospora schulzeri]|uniref:Uncharacterized protein n=1 Tax=Cytospora schulzeri TaxID=448051 RepID=A0A423WR78_9PEZI|nr:hypothetical protein VMCG_04618 [Valsa malicola]